MNKELIIQHYKTPTNWGEISGGISSKAENSACGDSVTVSLKVEEGAITAAKFTGKGCSICLGTADILMESIKGKNISEIETFPGSYVLKLIDMDENSPRKSCATISIEALKSAITNFS